MVKTKPKMLPMGYIAINKEYPIKQSFKGEVVDTLIKFPRDLGTAHPFGFTDAEHIYESVGVVSGGVNKITDSIVGDFTIKSRNPKVELVIAGLIKDTDFSTVLREWIKEAFLKGNGFMELDLDNTKIRCLNANNMYVKRTKKGVIKEYNQWLGDISGYSRTSLSNFTSFKPNKIAHLAINKLAGAAYGLGIVYPNERVIENMVIGEQDSHTVISRKAGAPLHVKMGVPGKQTSDEVLENMNQNLKYLTNKTEWVTDGNVEMKVIDFGNIGESIRETLDHDMQLLSYGMEIPLVLFGTGSVSEGLAKAQSEEKQRKIRAIQEDIECIIEEKIFKPFLIAQGLDGDVDFIWNLPGEDEINQRIEKLTKIIENFNVSEPLRRMAELEVARLLNFEDAPKFLAKPEKETPEELDAKKQTETNDAERKEEETKIKQPEVPGEKTTEKHVTNDLELNKDTDLELSRVESGEMSIREFINLKEIAGFNYSDYLVNILRRLRVDNFENLAAMSDTDLAVGKLSKVEVEKLRTVLREGFRKNRTVKQIETEITQSVALQNVTKDGNVIVEAAKRPNMIARTETVRLANLGLIDTYKKNDVKQVRWLAALSDRTCDICMGLDGNVYDINNVSPPPAHVNCRCSLLSVVS